MNKEILRRLNQPYLQVEDDDLDARFDRAIEADVPTARKLAIEIFNDLDPVRYGITWWGSLPTQERILISDYLYQTTSSIELNLAEARLHLYELAGARDDRNNRLSNSLSRDSEGQLRFNYPPSTKPLDDLPGRLERLHIAGFLRSIGSSLDCLGASIVGVCGLSVNLRFSDIGKAEKALSKITVPAKDADKLLIEFRDHFNQEKVAVGPEHWLEWATQYRNTDVHRGRRSTFHTILPRETPVYDLTGNWIPRMTTATNLAKYPDRSDAEALIKENDICLSEDAEITLSGIFKSTRNLLESTCQSLVSIWEKRRSNPSLISQPITQWPEPAKVCNFKGYNPVVKTRNDQNGNKQLIGNPLMKRRMLSSAATDQQRPLVWDDSKWR